MIKYLKNNFILCIIMSIWIINPVFSQKYDIIIKYGHVIDPKNCIDSNLDVAIIGDKISMLGSNIDVNEGKQIVNAQGMYIVPGLVDIHTHDFWGTEMDWEYMNGPYGVFPDAFTFQNGVTTVVDAGSSGWRTFHLLKKQTIDFSQTRILAFLNIVGEGMRGGPFEQNLLDMDVNKTAKFVKDNSDIIVGIKLAHYNKHDWVPVRRAEEAARLANVPLMVDFGGATPPLSLDTLLNQVFRVGDIFTHTFAESKVREFIVDTMTGKVKSFVWDAQKKGIIFDVGYGGTSFTFTQAIPALKDGFFPNTISTDLHIGDYNGSMKNILNVMSKFLLMGMKFPEIIRATTWNPAKAIKREELGHLTVGAIADIAILNVREGNFGFFDFRQKKMRGNKKIECEMTIKDGYVVYDLNAIATPVSIGRYYHDIRKQ